MSKNDTTALIEALKYWDSERFKTLQRKLSTARNTIEKEALCRELALFFTEDEVEILTRAAGILGSVKRKVEHAKEQKAREERERDQRLATYTSMRHKLLDIHLPKPETTAQARDSVLLHLAMQLHHREVSHGGYFPEYKFFLSSLDRALDPDTKNTLLGFAVDCSREVRRFLEDELWFYDEEPDKEKLLAVIKAFTGNWGPRTNAGLDFCSGALTA